jgi:hypothetical protein
MIAGSRPWPAVATSVKALATAAAAAAVPRIAKIGRPGGRLGSASEVLRNAYAITRSGKPPCQNM